MYEVQSERLTRLDESVEIPMEEGKGEAGKEVCEDQVDCRRRLRVGQEVGDGSRSGMIPLQHRVV